MYLDGENLGERIREHEISHYASAVSAIPEVRQFLFDMQRSIAEKNSVIMDGRDIGTVILPNADVKIFLVASSRNRAERRYKELLERGQSAVFEKILADIEERDARDSSRDIAPLKPADDAVLLDNSGFTPDESLAAALKIIEDKLDLGGGDEK
jgi:cytidylate kinase